MADKWENDEPDAKWHIYEPNESAQLLRHQIHRRAHNNDRNYLYI